MTHTSPEDVARYLEREVTGLQAQLDKWAAEFATNPAYALRWSDSMFMIAAEVELKSGLAKFLKGEVVPAFKGDRLACVREELTKDVMRAALYQKWSSTSVGANLMEECQRVAKAQLLELLDRKL